MTTIIAVKSAGGVAVAAESQVTVGGAIRQSLGCSKIQERQSGARSFLVGTAGDIRLMNLVRHFPMPATLDEAPDLHEWLATVMIPALRSYCEAERYPSEDDKADTDFEIIVVVDDRVWRIARDWSLFEPGGRFCVIGSGECYALGALHALSEACPEMGAAALATAALAAACEFDVSSSPPFTFVASLGGGS